LVARSSAWLGTLFAGLMLVLLILIASWLLRACAPVDVAMNVSTLEVKVTASPPSLPSPTDLLQASLVGVEADGKNLSIQLVALQDDLKNKAEQCKPAGAALAAERWNKKDLGLLKGCWQLGRDAPIAHHFANGPSERATAKAGQICFGNDGTGSHEQTMVDSKGTWHCKAPITARFADDGTLEASQPTGACDGTPPAEWAALRLNCRRTSDTTALCRGADGDGRINLEFRRAP
jgi:hypothetical protein